MFTPAYIQEKSVCSSEGQAEGTRDRYRDGLTERTDAEERGPQNRGDGSREWRTETERHGDRL